MNTPSSNIYWTPQLLAELESKIEAGATYIQLGKEYNIPPQLIQFQLEQAGGAKDHQVQSNAQEYKNFLDSAGKEIQSKEAGD